MKYIFQFTKTAIENSVSKIKRRSIFFELKT